MDDHADDRTASAVAHGDRQVDFTLRCVHCGYNLRGLFRDGRCPECGEAVADSPIDDALQASDPAWLKAIARGAKFLYAGCVVLVAGFICAVLPFLLTSPGPASAVFSATLGIAVLVIVPLLFLAGVILLTRQEPRVTLVESQTAWRPLCRWSMILVVAAVFVRWMIDTFSLSFPIANSPMILGWAGRLIWAAILCLFVICLSRYGEQLVLRLPDPKLAKKVRSRGSGFVGCFAVAETLSVIIIVYSSRGGPGATPSVPGSGGIALWGGIAHSLAWLGVLLNVVGLMAAIGQLRRALKKCVAETADDVGVQGA